MSDDAGHWDRGWDGHTRAQCRRLAALPLAAKLQWLEEADRLVRRLHEGRKRKLARDGTTEPRSQKGADDH